jgi:hypothetical protein
MGIEKEDMQFNYSHLEMLALLVGKCCTFEITNSTSSISNEKKRNHSMNMSVGICV